VQLSASGPQRDLQVLEDLLGLRLEVALADNGASRVYRVLPADVDSARGWADRDDL
jgi:hypothetical protein